MPEKTVSLDAVDRKILKALQLDGKLTNVALAEKLGMSPSPCLRRVKHLEDIGIINRYVAIVAAAKAGLGLSAFVEVKVPQVSDRAIVEEFKEAVRQEEYIVSCFITAGQYDFLLRVVAKDMDHYGRLAQDTLLKLPGVQDLRTSFVLEAFKETTQLPL